MSLRPGSRYRVKTASRQGMAAEQAPDGQRPADKWTAGLEGDGGVLRAGGLEAAGSGRAEGAVQQGEMPRL